MDTKIVFWAVCRWVPSVSEFAGMHYLTPSVRSTRCSLAAAGRWGAIPQPGDGSAAEDGVREGQSRCVVPGRGLPVRHWGLRRVQLSMLRRLQC